MRRGSGRRAAAGGSRARWPRSRVLAAPAWAREVALAAGAPLPRPVAGRRRGARRRRPPGPVGRRRRRRHAAGRRGGARRRRRGQRPHAARARDRRRGVDRGRRRPSRRPVRPRRRRRGLRLPRVRDPGPAAPGTTTAVRIEDARGARIEDLVASGDGRGPGVTAYETPGLLVQGGRLTGFLDGLYLERADGGRVAGVTVERSVRYGLHVMFTVGVELRRQPRRGRGRRVGGHVRPRRAHRGQPAGGPPRPDGLRPPAPGGGGRARRRQRGARQRASGSCSWRPRAPGSRAARSRTTASGRCCSGRRSPGAAASLGVDRRRRLRRQRRRRGGRRPGRGADPAWQRLRPRPAPRPRRRRGGRRGVRRDVGLRGARRPPAGPRAARPRARHRAVAAARGAGPGRPGRGLRRSGTALGALGAARAGCGVAALGLAVALWAWARSPRGGGRDAGRRARPPAARRARARRAWRDGSSRSTCASDAGVVALVGANGAGKSTLLALAAGRLLPTGGRVRVAGAAARDPRAAAARADVPQAVAFPARARVRELLGVARARARRLGRGGGRRGGAAGPGAAAAPRRGAALGGRASARRPGVGVDGRAAGCGCSTSRRRRSIAMGWRGSPRGCARTRRPGAPCSSAPTATRRWPRTSRTGSCGSKRGASSTVPEGRDAQPGHRRRRAVRWSP